MNEPVAIFNLDTRQMEMLEMRSFSSFRTSLSQALEV